MSIADAWANIEAHLKADAESVKARLEQDLPTVAQFVQDAATNPVTAALAAAVHLPEAPEYLQLVADYIGKLDAVIGTAKAAGAAQAAQPAEAPAP